MSIDHDNLEDFADPFAYDASDTSDTGVTFSADLARETGSPVLEIACGTGRVSIPIARLGLEVTGLDLVPGMLDVAQGKSAGLPTRWVHGDARSFDLGEQFRLVFLTGNAFQLFLTRADQEAMLGRARAHLQDDGLLAFETRNPRWRRLVRSGKEATLEAGRPRGEGFFAFLESKEDELETLVDESSHAVRVSRTQVYDHVAQILHLTTSRRWREGDQARTTRTSIALRYTFPQELEALMHYNGFAIIRQYGDWNLEPLAADSPSIIVVCRKRAYPPRP